MLEPEGVKEQEKLVYMLNKSLYDLKRGPKCLFKIFNSFIVSLGYNTLRLDCCTYYNRFDGDDFIILVLYVDDMLELV